MNRDIDHLLSAPRQVSDAQAPIPDSVTPAEWSTEEVIASTVDELLKKLTMNFIVPQARGFGEIETRPL